ncbi:MAG: alpha/beta fold hydrolase [Synergistales bacterium]|nr:alpha/beta fold hydrolase [Synergistales bacterium]
MEYNSICKDPDIRDTDHPSGVMNIILHQGHERLHGIIYTPQGAGPHPTILLLHGFPGYEKNLDLAQILRRAGFNVIQFHYRGSWGSEGDYSFANVLSDVSMAVRYFTEKENAEKYNVDTSRMILIGHSLGGFAALMTAPHYHHLRHVISIACYNLGAVTRNYGKDEKFKDKTREMFEECTVPLKGTGVYDLVEEMKVHQEVWDIANHGEELREKHILLISGEEDDISELEIHHKPIALSLKNSGAGNLREVLLPDGHSFHDTRIKLAHTILEWLEKEGFRLS